jgi:lysophospholipase L1-like esterase
MKCRFGIRSDARRALAHIIGCLIPRRIFPFILTITTVGCSSHSTVQPTPAVDDPVLSCPADIAVTAHNGQPATATFDTPVASKGSAPITVVCVPGSATQFDAGTTTVTCTATDSRQHMGSCSFSVIVNAIPQLLKTKFMAFGDSITEGKIPTIGPSIVVPAQCPTPTGQALCFNTSSSYVEQLNTKLAARYQDQTVTIVADGLGDEEAGGGKLRLPADLATYQPDVLLLLEGVNDLLHTTDPTKIPGAINSIVNALGNDIDSAQSRGAKTYLATLPPLNPAKQSQASAIQTVNAQIKTLAAQKGVILVDMNAAITLDLVGSDGIHLTSAGYGVMADTWLKAIESTLEAPTPAK